LFDINKGNNGTCTPPAEGEYFCTAETGYDGPTGNGTPNGPLAVTQPSKILHHIVYPSANAFQDQWTPSPTLEGLEAAWERTKQEGKLEGGEEPALTHFVFTSEAKEEAIKAEGYKLAEGEKVLSATMHVYAKVGWGDELYVHLFHNGSSETNRTIVGTAVFPGEHKWYVLPPDTTPETNAELEALTMKAYLLMGGNYSDIFAWYVDLETKLS
jgi:hypothetical protein